jgi:hypothetical protein
MSHYLLSHRRKGLQFEFGAIFNLLWRQSQDLTAVETAAPHIAGVYTYRSIAATLFALGAKDGIHCSFEAHQKYARRFASTYERCS